MDLIELRRPLQKVAEELSPFGDESEEPLVKLEPRHVISVLERYLAGKLAASDVEDWAEAIETRADVEVHEEATLSRAVFILANPTIEGALDREQAQNLVQSLRNAPAQ